MFTISLIASLFVIGSCVQLQYKDCGSSASLQSATLTPCTANPCHIHVNSTYTGTITFTPSKGAAKATNNVTGAVVTATSATIVPFGEYEKDACKQTLNCPLMTGRQETFSPAIMAPKYMLTDNGVP